MQTETEAETDIATALREDYCREKNTDGHVYELVRWSDSFKGSSLEPMLYEMGYTVGVCIG